MITLTNLEKKQKKEKLIREIYLELKATEKDIKGRPLTDGAYVNTGRDDNAAATIN